VFLSPLVYLNKTFSITCKLIIKLILKSNRKRGNKELNYKGELAVRLVKGIANLTSPLGKLSI
jgi:hypothetical protein